MLNIHSASLAPTDRQTIVPHAAPGPENGASVIAQAMVELSESQSDALEETQEDLSFALGGRLRELRNGKEHDSSSRDRVLMHKLVAEVAMIAEEDLSDLNDDSAWQHAPQLLSALQAQYPAPGAAALHLAAWLAHRQPGARLRSRMEAALASLMADDQTAIALFATLEFGAVTPGLRQELLQLYHRALAPRRQISQWLNLLGKRQQRHKKIRAMLHLLAYALSASGQPIVGSHLAAVIDDLRQLLRLLGLEDYCDRAAAALGMPAISGEGLMLLVVQLIEQIWLNADTLAEMLPPQAELDRYRLLQSLGKLIQLLPDACFNDADHRLQLDDAIHNLSDSIVS
ncbi:TyeA family type III secretion system gatekeeper subunit [Edwardsiella piscicida]|uniref:TyeA family type III secretion system gatekeeper subunit n=1 Tax=Edwardsiella piscicida TaxID=1263550 RepID=UPI0002C0E9ED|nr:TyeA family type III secretion system gatekeeper subunit [Edwardsiella piscicida]AGH72950.1 type III secretion apparatus [Edwardsiella piscicida C07-087]EKS7778588.1 TyeA family type III secretion system gatekeeper subunit [Edwardsiella piscicida]EKS7782056.1 TyeA family type III secretion system gatekeeper subunit [Edwardsiella piscicida]UCQ25229.1 TyeA family type III secretion system gatekeeper subunit [Edwardsiella piscicida]UCQ35371.1 TyeA family type III secretion system gatekeeper su